MESHNDDKEKIVCDNCGDIFNKEDRYINHLVSCPHYENIGFTSSNFNKVSFSKPSSYDTNSISSDDCGEIFDDENIYLDHLACHPDTDYTNVMRRDICELLSSKLNNYDSELLTCDNCGKIFDEKNKYLHHLISSFDECRNLSTNIFKSPFSESNNYDKYFQACKYCGELFFEDDKYFNHQVTSSCAEHANFESNSLHNPSSKLVDDVLCLQEHTSCKHVKTYEKKECNDNRKKYIEEDYNEENEYVELLDPSAGTKNSDFTSSSNLNTSLGNVSGISLAFSSHNEIFNEKDKYFDNLHSCPAAEYKNITTSDFHKPSSSKMNNYDTESLTCNICSKHYSNKKCFRQHNQLVHGAKKYVCHFCNKAFTKKYTLLRHVKIHNYSKAKSSALQNIIFSSLSSQEHKFSDIENSDFPSSNLNMLSDNQDIDSLICDNCNEIFDEEDKYLDHLVSCPVTENKHFTTNNFHMSSLSSSPICDVDYLICSVCDKQYANQKNLRYQLVHGARNHICHICKKSFTKNYALLRHFKSHKSNATKHTSEGNVCSDSYSQDLHISRHMNTQHINSKIYQDKCDVFNESSPKQLDLFHHIKTRKEEELFGYDDCCEIFNEKKEYVNHLLSCSGNEYSDFKMSYTPKSRTKDIKHPPPKSSIKNIKPPICEICNKEFKSTQNLQGHSLVHSGIKNHVCNACNRAFGHKYSLTRHMKLHESDKINIQYTCDICDRSFPLKISITKHMMKHENQKKACNKSPYSRQTYECDICNKMCKTKAGLARHNKKHETLNT